MKINRHIKILIIVVIVALLIITSAPAITKFVHIIGGMYSEISAFVRCALLELYSEVKGESTNFTFLSKIIIDEKEDDNVRINAIYALPSKDKQVNPFLESMFYASKDQRVAYHSLKYLWTYDSAVGEKIADKVLSDYENYSPEQLCASIVAKQVELRENVGQRSDDVLFEEKEKFAQLCIYIHENYTVDFHVSAESWNNPVIISAVSLSETGTEISARYLLDEEKFVYSDRLDYDSKFYISYSAARHNCRSLLELA